MDPVLELSKCSCKFEKFKGLELGPFPMSTRDEDTLKYCEKKYNLIDEAIHFLGPANSLDKCTIKDKINEIKEKIGEYYFDKDCKLIAIPNQILLDRPETKNPFILESSSNADKSNLDDKDLERIQQNKEKENKFLDKYYEDILHQQSIKALRDKKISGFLIQGFHSEDCLKAKLNKAKEKREGDEFAELNKDEIDIMEILDITNLDNEMLQKCVGKTLNSDSKNKSEPLAKDCPLFSKVKKSYQEDKFKELKKKTKIELENYWKFQFYKSSVQLFTREWDSVIVIPESKIFINIEVKSGENIKALKKAADQTNKHLNFARKVFGPMISKEWQFIKSAFSPNFIFGERSKELCAHCKQYILSTEDLRDMKPWLEKLMASNSNVKGTEFQNDYDTILVAMIGFASMRQVDSLNKLIVDPYEISLETELKLTGQTQGLSVEAVCNQDLNQGLDETETKYMCYMLTPDQINAVKCPAKLLLISGDYGTGKTYVLKERAKSCAINYRDDKICYLNLTGLINPTTKVNRISPAPLTLMDHIALQDFLCYPNVEVVTWRSIVNYVYLNKDNFDASIYNAMDVFLKTRNYNHLFIDEFVGPNDVLAPNFFSTSGTICIALKWFPDIHNKKWISFIKNDYQATVINLEINMRNSENVIQLSKAVGFDPNTKSKFSLPGKTIIGPTCYVYKNVYQLNLVFLARAAVAKYFDSKPKESVVVLVRKSEAENVFNDLTLTYSNNRKVVFLKAQGSQKEYGKELHDFVEAPEGILVASMINFQGVQARNIIFLLGNDMEEMCNIDLRNYILRCMSFAIVICNEQDYRDVLGVVEDKDLHMHVPVSSSDPTNILMRNAESINLSDLVKQIIQRFLVEKTKESLTIISEDDVKGEQIFTSLLNTSIESSISFLPHRMFLHKPGLYQQALIRASKNAGYILIITCPNMFECGCFNKDVFRNCVWASSPKKTIAIRNLLFNAKANCIIQISNEKSNLAKQIFKLMEIDAQNDFSPVENTEMGEDEEYIRPAGSKDSLFVRIRDTVSIRKRDLPLFQNISANIPPPGYHPISNIDSMFSSMGHAVQFQRPIKNYPARNVAGSRRKHCKVKAYKKCLKKTTNKTSSDKNEISESQICDSDEVFELNIIHKIELIGRKDSKQ